MSANASKGKLKLIKGGLDSAVPPAFDAEAVSRRITRALSARDADDRDAARAAVLKDARVMLHALGVMGAEILRYRQEIKAFAQQSSDQATINSVLLALAGGEVRVDGAWFAAYEVKGGFSVTEEGDEVVIRALIVDPESVQGASSTSASQQTEE